MNDFENEKNFEDTEPEIKNTDAPEENGAPDPVLEEKAACENASCPEKEQEAEDAGQKVGEGSEEESLKSGKEQEEKERSCKEGKEKGHCHRELQKAREEIEKLKAEGEETKMVFRHRRIRKLSSPHTESGGAKVHGRQKRRRRRPFSHRGQPRTGACRLCRRKDARGRGDDSQKLQKAAGKRKCGGTRSYRAVV